MITNPSQPLTHRPERSLELKFPRGVSRLLPLTRSPERSLERSPERRVFHLFVACGRLAIAIAIAGAHRAQQTRRARGGNGS